MSLVHIDDYEDAVERYLGWCTSCKDFTREQTEPDAEEYLCPICDEDTVFGAENAYIDGLFEIDGSEDSYIDE